MCANTDRGKLWDTSGWGTSDKETHTQKKPHRGDPMIHINMITKHFMQIETLIERL